MNTLELKIGDIVKFHCIACGLPERGEITAIQPNDCIAVNILPVTAGYSAIINRDDLLAKSAKQTLDFPINLSLH